MKSSLTPFQPQRILKVRDALFHKAIAAFYFWGRECNFGLPQDPLAHL
jgi:hypothetical protein